MGAKGQPKTGGRVAGTPNKVKDGLRQKIQNFADENFDEVIAAWHEITEPDKKIKAYNDICAYALPKLQAVQLDANIQRTNDIEEDLRKLAEG